IAEEQNEQWGQEEQVSKEAVIPQSSKPVIVQLTAMEESAHQETLEPTPAISQLTRPPSFVTPSPSAPAGTSDMSSAKVSRPPLGFLTAMQTGNEPSVKDIFSMGGWKGVTTTEAEEDEEIPEIDMDFDSDEE